MLDYVPNHASTYSDYFIKSENREPGYEDYFVWADPVMVDGKPDVPSNWVRTNFALQITYVIQAKLQ